MRRIHFIEIEDESWCPAVIRDATTDYLKFFLEKTNPYKVVLGKLQNALETNNRNKIIDLCSGGGGAWGSLMPLLLENNSEIKVYLTDKYPNLTAFEELQGKFPSNLEYSTEEVDATQVPAKLKGFRTLFTSFHHFRPENAREILADAVSNNEGIAIFEFTQRKILTILLMFLTPLFVLVLTPFIRPFRFSRLILTYLIPVVPFSITFDGIVSCMRTYTPEELQEMTKNLSPNYQWEIGEMPIKGSIVPVTFLVGYPTR